MPNSPSRLVLAALLAGLLWLPASQLGAQTVDEHFPAIPTPPAAGTYAEPLQQALDEGYAQLARVTGPADEAALEAAKAAFRRALDQDPRNVHAWNGTGIYELTKDEGWLILLESLKKVFNRDHISMAVKAFERALEAEPAFHPARYNLALAHRQARGKDSTRRAATELERLVAEAPETGLAPLLLVLTYRDLGDQAAMEKALESLPATEAFPASTRLLLLAWSRFAGGRPDEGAATYWQGVDAIATDREALLFWHDIRPIATAEEDAEFGRLGLAARKSWLMGFWQRLADQSFVMPDARLAEHYRRLDHVYRNFRLDLPERRHYSAAAAYVPPWQTGFDDRGIIYLRHGPPSDIATYTGPEVERNVSWKYDQPGGNPIVFHFAADEDVSDYKLVRTLRDILISNNTSMKGRTLLDPHAGTNAATRGLRFVDRDDRRILAEDRRALQEIYRSRGSLDPMYDRAALNLDQQILQREEATLARGLQIGVGTRSFRPGTPDAPLPFAVQAVAFRGPGGEPRVEFFYAFPTSQVAVLGRPDGGSQIDYDYRLQVAPEAGVEPLRRGGEVHITTRRPIPTGRGVMLPAVESVTLEPGAFRYGMKLTDLTSGRFGIVEGALAVDDFSGLSLSGLLLASSIEQGGDPSDPFVRGGLRVLPLPSHVFRRSQPVYVYYEIYGLGAGAARYRTTYSLEARERNRNVVVQLFSAVGELLTRSRERGGITYQFEQAAAAADPLVETFSIDVKESPAGDYTLTVEIEDLETGRTTRRQAPLTLVD